MMTIHPKIAASLCHNIAATIPASVAHSIAHCAQPGALYAPRVPRRTIKRYGHEKQLKTCS